MFYCTVNDGEWVFQQGDKASTYFLIGKREAWVMGVCVVFVVRAWAVPDHH